MNLKQLVVYRISPVRLSLHSKDTFYILYRKTYPTGVYPNMMLWKNRATACGNGSNRYVQFVGNDPPNDLGMKLVVLVGIDSPPNLQQLETFSVPRRNYMARSLGT